MHHIKYKPKRVVVKDAPIRRRLMHQYAKMCGYNYPPFTWREDDYTVQGWKELIKDAR